MSRTLNIHMEKFYGPNAELLERDLLKAETKGREEGLLALASLPCNAFGLNSIMVSQYIPELHLMHK